MSQSRKVARPLPDIHWAPAECIGDYALTETQQRLRTDCWKRVLIVAKHAGTSDRLLPYPVPMRVASPDSQ